MVCVQFRSVKAPTNHHHLLRDLDPSHIGTQYEFIDCDRQSGFAVDGCKGCPDGDACINVPYSYVGNYLTYGGWGMPYEFCIKDGNILQTPDYSRQ